jgi:GNAT superfamily N-acetyltransferase
MAQSVIARHIVGGITYEIDTAKDRLDIGLIHDFLSRCSHWACGIPRDVLEQAIANSLCFGLYRDGAQIGFARVITDEATFAYVADVFVLESHRGQGLGLWLMETIRAHPHLRGLRRWSLVTRDAHALYRQVGFADVANPGRWMEIVDRDVYTRSALTPAPLPGGEGRKP